MDFFGSSDVKESAYNAGDLGSIPRLGRSPGGGHGNPLQYSCLKKSHGQRSLSGYSQWGRKELDTSKRLSTAQHWKIPWATECGNVYQHQWVNTGWVRSSFVDS